MRSELELRILGPESLDRPAAPEPRAAEGGASFAGELGRAVESLDRMQVEADEQASLVAQGGGNLHEMSIALEKADISMRLALKVRNKVVEAYNEIMRMTV
jgi:flagellar hook-basal body complex protein FliE